MARTKQETYNLILTKRPTLDDYREHYNENPELETVLPFQQVVNERQQFLDIVRRWANNEIEFNDDFMLKYSPTSRGKSYPFQNVGYGFMQKYESFLRTIPVKLNQSQGHDYNEFIRDSKNVNFSLPSQVIEPIEVTSRNINLYNKRYDDIKKQYYWTATNINQPFKLEDITDLENNPTYLIEAGNKTPFVEIGEKSYIEEDSTTSSFTQTGQAQARARQDTQRSKIAQKEEQPLELVQEAFAESIDKKTWWVTRPGGEIQQIKVSDSGKKILESRGWIFHENKPKPTEIELLPEVIKILRMINYKNYIPDFNIKAIIPKWFENNIRWVESGQISQQEFINSYNELVSSGAIIEEQKGLPKRLPDESCQDYRSRVAQAGFLVDWIKPCPEPQVNDTVNFPMVKQTAIDFQIKGSRITGTVIFDKISANWNNYYDGRNLVSYFETTDLADIKLVNKPNIVKFRPTEPPLLPTERVTINESTEGKDKIKVRLFLFTEDNVPVAEPLEFLLQEGEIIIAKTKPRRTDFLGTIGAGIAGAIGISLLLSGVKNKS